MFRTTRTMTLTLLSAAVCVIALASPAYAATWTAKIGTTATGSGTYTATSSGSSTFTDTTTGVTITCSSETAAGSVPHLGSGLSGTAIMTQTASTYSACTGAGLTFSISDPGTWSINVTSYSGGVVTGYISGISQTFSASGCSFTVTGSIDFTFNVSTQVLSIAAVAGSGHVLTISSVSGCFGVVANGHPGKWSKVRKILAKTAAGIQALLSITSP